MSTSTRIKALAEGGMLSAIAIILSLIGLYLPVFEFLRYFPLPLVLIVVRQNVKLGIMAYFIIAILLAVLAHPLKGLMALAGFNFMGVVMGWCIQQNKGVAKTLIYSTLSAFGVIVAGFAVAAIFLKIDPIESLTALTRKVYALSIENSIAKGVPPEQLELEKKVQEIFIWAQIVILPAFLLVCGFVIAWANFKLSRFVLGKLGQEINDLLPLKLWDFPEYVLHGWFIGVAAAFAGKYYFGSEALTLKIGLNIIYAFSALLYFQGMAVISFYAAKYELPKAVRIPIVLASIPFAVFVALCGVYDIIYNFRRLERKG